MTCIVGAVHGKKVWLGGDSAGSDGWRIQTRTEPKVWISGEFAFGFCSSFRFGALLRYSFKPPPIKAPIEKYFATEFVPKLRECFKDDTELQPESEGKYPDIEFLIGLRGKLYVCQSDYQVGQHRDGFCAIGSGCDLATGSLFATQKMRPRERLVMALNAAERFTTFVRSPFTIVSV